MVDNLRHTEAQPNENNMAVTSNEAFQQILRTRSLMSGRTTDANNTPLPTLELTVDASANVAESGDRRIQVASLNSNEQQGQDEHDRRDGLRLRRTLRADGRAPSQDVDTLINRLGENGARSTQWTRDEGTTVNFGNREWTIRDENVSLNNFNHVIIQMPDGSNRRIMRGLGIDQNNDGSYRSIFFSTPTMNDFRLNPNDDVTIHRDFINVNRNGTTIRVDARGPRLERQ